MFNLVYVPIIIICFVGAMSPGPSLLVILQRLLVYGRFVTILLVLGHALGIGIYAFLAVSGASVFLDIFPKFFLVLQMVGLLFLFYIGFSAFRMSRKLVVDSRSLEDSGQAVKGFWEGLFLALFNPKIMIWFLAVFSPFIDVKASYLDRVVLVIIPFLVDFLWYVCVITIASKIDVSRFFRPLNLVSGWVLMGISVFMLIFGLFRNFFR